MGPQWRWVLHTVEPLYKGQVVLYPLHIVEPLYKGQVWDESYSAWSLSTRDKFGMGPTLSTKDK